MSKVSVIVPVYNAERFLSEAIESVLNQTYTDFELLLINDNSSDNSKKVCEEYAQKDNRIVLLENNTENHGPGPTRNIGLDNATGDCIYFMDADDWIDKNLLESAVSRMQETDADIVQFGIVCQQEDGGEPLVYCREDKYLLIREDIKNDFFEFWSRNRLALTLHLFRKETVSAIRFENIISGEDVSYVTDALANAKIIAYIHKALYYYRYVAGSTSRRWNMETVKCRETIWEHQKNFLDSFGESMDKSAYAKVAYDNYIWAIFQLSSSLCPLSYKEKKQQLSMLNERTEFEKYRKYCSLKHQHGIDKVKCIFVKFRMEKLLLLFGPLFLKIVRGE